MIVTPPLDDLVDLRLSVVPGAQTVSFTTAVSRAHLKIHEVLDEALIKEGIEMPEVLLDRIFPCIVSALHDPTRNRSPGWAGPVDRPRA
jgi:hypothetical protein